ncbi:Protein arginine N-methyltransferase 5 [Heterocephalus glaber]|uniref:Protein arginine N-methyltransferase 5 n=1 Tax=Heterocephalus glaber TaxID=10181 RepID=G5AWR0_HETGA|nr:Protein arginine N-methyltransferase 5 [Heterocephalus glaber]
MQTQKWRKIRRNSEVAVLQELNFEAYLGLPAFLLPLNEEDNTNLARVLTNHIHNGHHSSMFWMRKEFCSYVQYLEYLSQNRPPPNAYELFAKGYEDYLQSPLQDGAQHFLKDDGVSIPGEYTSFLAPIPSSKLYNEVRACREKDRDPEAQFEMPYVVRLHNFHQLSAPQPCFTFSHPNRSMIDKNRYCTLEFPVEVNTVLHGFEGYFETMLCQDVTLSIHPETHSPGIFSWFPILFPIKQPIMVHEGQTIFVRFWRCSSSKKVWYEWAVTAPVCCAIHNPTGRSYTIGL